MPVITQDPAARRRSLAAVIAAMAIVHLIIALTFPLLALILARQGVSEGLIGINTAAQAVAVFFVAPLTPRLIRKFGPARVMLASLLVAAASISLLPVFPHVHAWFPLRFVLGGAGSALWLTSEAWINAMAGEKTRGRIISIYTSAGAAGLAAGPAILMIAGTEGHAPFIIGVGLMLAASVILAMADRTKDHFPAHERGSPLWRLLLIAPAPLVVNFFFAAAEESLATFLPIYTLQVGHVERVGLLLLVMTSVGGIATQFTIGWIADRTDRYRLLLGLVMATIAAYGLLPWALTSVPLAVALVFAAGGLSHGVYTLGIVLFGQHFRGVELAGASAVATLMWGTGAFFGAPAAGAMMTALGPGGLVVTVVGLFALYLPFPLMAWLRGRGSNRKT